MNERPLVSVLMTAYNSGAFIDEAINSVLASTYTNFELIIVDDCSTDNTAEIVKTYLAIDKRISYYLNEKNLGDYNNRNKAASYAKGKYIKYCDSDDIIYPHGLEVMVRAMEQYPDAGFGVSAVPEVDRPYPVVLTPKEAYLEHFNGYLHFFRAPGSAIIVRDAFNKLGGFSGERMIGDHDMWHKMAMYYPMVKFVACLYWDRQHPNQERRSKYAREEYPRLLDVVLQRYFTHKDCPLTEAEKEAILKDRNKGKLKRKISDFLKNIISN